MKNKIALWVIAIGLLVSAVGIAQAQDTTTTDKDATAASDSHSNVRTLTGCLRQGESSNEYELVAQNGSTWELKSDTIDFAPHIGHTVTITGAVAHSGMHNMKEDAKQEAQEHGMDKSATEHGHLTVTNLSMVSSSCSK